MFLRAAHIQTFFFAHSQSILKISTPFFGIYSMKGLLLANNTCPVNTAQLAYHSDQSCYGTAHTCR